MDPRLDGVTHELPKTLDYKRLVEATDLTVRWDTEGPGTRAEIAKRVDMDALSDIALRRARQTAGVFTTPGPRAPEILDAFTHVWIEGFMSAIVYTEQVKMTSLFGKLPDKNLLGATSSIMQSWGRGENAAAEWRKRVDLHSVSHVGRLRALQTVQMFQLDEPAPPLLRSAQGATWQDGFSMGLLFQELGGHRED